MKNILKRINILVVLLGMFLIVGCGGGGATKNQLPTVYAGEDQNISSGIDVILSVQQQIVMVLSLVIYGVKVV